MATALEDYFPECPVWLLFVLVCLLAGTVSSTSINAPSTPKTAATRVAEAERELTLTAYRLREASSPASTSASAARNYKFTYDAVSLGQSALRRCLIVQWSALKGRRLADALVAATGAILVIVPADLLPPTSKSEHGTLEEQFAQLTTTQAVYFAVASEATNSLVDSIKQTRAATALEQMLNVFVEDAFQITSAASAPALAKPQLINIVGRLSAPDRNAPSIIVVAHYDSRSVAPGLAVGYDSNGSGAMALLMVMQRLSEYYKMKDMRPKLHTVFALTAAGDLNYRGSRQLAEDMAERQAEGERILLVICLEALLGGDSNELFVHASRTPQEKTAPYNFLRRMENFVPEDCRRDVIVKNNIDADAFAWEHEAYFHNRLSSLTISRFNAHDSPARTALINDVDPRDEATQLRALVWRTRVVAETLTSYAFSIDMDWCSAEVRADGNCHILRPFAIDEASPLRALFAVPRPTAALPKSLIADLMRVGNNYCNRVDQRDFSAADLVLQPAQPEQLSAQVVKPALFELILASVIAEVETRKGMVSLAAYLFGIYHFALNAHDVLGVLAAKAKAKAH